MRALLQRSKNSKVIVENKVIGHIDKGLVVLVGFTQNDNSENIDYIINKILNLRIFDDEDGVMNKSILDIGGSILSISQFTLYSDSKKGNRPNYINALKREDAKILYNEFNNKLKEKIKVETGIYGAEMEVSITNDGPVTIMLER